MNNFGDQPFINFQNFDSNPSNAGGSVHVDLGTPNQQLFGSPNDPTGAAMMQDLQGFPGQQQKPNEPRSFWTIEYYQKYFNVSTSDVVERLKRSMLPNGVDNFLLAHIRPNPDLYGPFWVCITLIFAIGISGNIANYFQYASSGMYHWKYEFHIVSQAATCIFMYAWFLPLVLWGCLMWSKNQEQQQTNQENELIESSATIGLLELICLYGYSLTIFIPVAFLWTIQIKLLQWSLALIATVLSGGVLLKSIMPVIPGKQKPIYIAVILGMHLILAAGFIMYFFHTPTLPVHADLIYSSTSTTTTTTAASVKINPAMLPQNGSLVGKAT